MPWTLIQKKTRRRRAGLPVIIGASVVCHLREYSVLYLFFFLPPPPQASSFSLLRLSRRDCRLSPSGLLNPDWDIHRPHCADRVVRTSEEYG